MNSNETRTLWISVGAALLAVLMLYSYTQTKTEELTKKFGAKEIVVVARDDIQAMETITEEMLTSIEKPIEYLEPKAIKNQEIAVGQVALAPIKKGEQVLQSKIMEPGPVTGLSLQVAPGWRAVTLPIDEMRGIAKLVKPGDRIDILASLDIGRGVGQKKMVKTIMEDVSILATGLTIVNELPRLYEKRGRDEYIRDLREDTKFNTITVEVKPDAAQKLIYILATAPGSLFLTLRHPSDHTKKALPTTSIANLMGQTSSSVLSKQVRGRTPASRAAKVKAPVKPAPKRKRKKRSNGFRDL